MEKNNSSIIFNFRVVIWITVFISFLGTTTTAGQLNPINKQQEENLMLIPYSGIFSGILDDGSFSVVTRHDDGLVAIHQCSEDGNWRRIGQFSGIDPSNENSHLTIEVVNPSGSVVAGRFRRNREIFRWTAKEGVKSLGAPYREKDKIIAVGCIGISHDGSVILGKYWGLWIEKEGFRELGIHPRYKVQIPEALSADGSTVVGVGRNPGLHLFKKKSSALRWKRTSGFHDLGDLKGGKHYSNARDVSADGAAIVGSGDMDFKFGMSPKLISSLPYRWTYQNGFEKLDKGGYDIGMATMVSGDGTIVIGSISNRNDEYNSSIPVCWNAEGVLFHLRELLAQAGMNEQQYNRFHLMHISNNGKYIILGAHRPEGSYRLYRVNLSGTALFP